MPDTMMTPETPVSATHSPTIAKLAAALAAAQKNFAPIPKDREVTVYSDRGNYKFKYATLDAIRSATMPALAEQTLAVVQGMIERGNGYAVETRLIHSSGEWISNITPMFVSGRVKDGRQYPPTNQELGSAQSYARRYGLSALLCITADEDDDGNTADGNHIEGSQRVPYKPKTGSAGGGSDFRAPNGRSQSSANGRRMAAEEPELVANAAGRQKGSLTHPKGEKKSEREEKTERFVDNTIQTLNLSGQTTESLDKLWKMNAEQIGWIEANFPGQYERLVTAFDNARESAKAAA